MILIFKSIFGDIKNKNIIIRCIADIPLFFPPEYQSHFQILEKERHELLTNKFAIYFFELRKLKKSQKGKQLEDWLNLINSEKRSKTVEESCKKIP